MRVRARVAIGAGGFSVVAGFVGRTLESDGVYVLSGLAFIAAVVVGISLLPFWARLGLHLPPMRLFPPIGPGERWDAKTGTVVPADDTAPRKRNVRPPKRSGAPGRLGKR